MLVEWRLLCVLGFFFFLRFRLGVFFRKDFVRFLYGKGEIFI